MTGVRVLFGVVGTAVLGYGVWLLLQQVQWRTDFLFSLGGWLVAGPPLHDLLVAPATALVGLFLARSLPRPWRTTVSIGLFATATLFLIGGPVLTRPMAGPPNPGLDDRNYLPGLLWFVAAMWVLLLTAAAARAAWRRRSSDSPDAGRRPLDTN